jgi:hypothetical protein
MLDQSKSKEDSLKEEIKEKPEVPQTADQEVRPFSLENNQEETIEQINDCLLKKVSTNCTIGDLSPDTH